MHKRFIIQLQMYAKVIGIFSKGYLPIFTFATIKITGNFMQSEKGYSDYKPRL